LERGGWRVQELTNDLMISTTVSFEKHSSIIDNLKK
jgi:hypothetical protein